MSFISGFAQHRHAYAIAASAAMGSIFYGWDIGLIGGVLALPSFKAYFDINSMSKAAQADLSGNIVAVLQGGCFFGALFTGYLSNTFGRKPILIVSGLIYLIGSLIQALIGLGTSSDTALRLFYFSRFFAGLGVGMVSALVPSYVSESVPRSIRGRCTGMVQLANNVGIMLSFWVNYGVSMHYAGTDNMQWRLPLIIQLIPGVLFIGFMAFQPESPRWLVEHGHFDRAAKSLARASGCRPDDDSVLAELAEIKGDFEGKEKTPIIKQFALMAESRTTALRCFIPSLVMFFQQATGTNAINYFSPTIFASLGISSTTSGLFATGVYGVVKTVSVALVLAFAVEGLGRKRCLMIGGLGQGLMMLWIGGFSAVHPQPNIAPASYVSIVAVYLYAVFYCVGWGPLPWVVAAEVAPNHVRAASQSLAIGVNWLFSFTVSKLTPIMLNRITYGTYLVFGVFCIIMVTWTYFCLPETKGYALEDIRFLFEDSVCTRALQDAPGGRIFLGSKRVPSVEELKAREIGSDDEIVEDIKEDHSKV
ncbi:sugar porter family MFS transporter [Phanerochaete sordida]|uniref:Sugar porter family MFS transporter n=1 Tax=Phanerochaete sordida TaxID=48140 RepID=A0A9P3LBY0_9APHY|nr:sugar porter family MFS transporter [Phanerochaete sordida]